MLHYVFFCTRNDKNFNKHSDQFLPFKSIKHYSSFGTNYAQNLVTSLALCFFFPMNSIISNPFHSPHPLHTGAEFVEVLIAEVVPQLPNLPPQLLQDPCGLLLKFPLQKTEKGFDRVQVRGVAWDEEGLQLRLLKEGLAQRIYFWHAQSSVGLFHNLFCFSTSCSIRQISLFSPGFRKVATHFISQHCSNPDSQWLWATEIKYTCSKSCLSCCNRFTGSRNQSHPHCDLVFSRLPVSNRTGA